MKLNTVRNHVQGLLAKLEAHSRLEAVAKAGRRGLLDSRLQGLMRTHQPD